MILKSRIKNIAKNNNVSAQVVLQNFMFECFLRRLSITRYKDVFIIKGGLLISSIVGINARSTMDLDTTIKNFPNDQYELSNAIREICNTFIEDDVSFFFYGIENIRKDDIYGGYRASIISHYEDIKTPLKIDITFGDIITPSEVEYRYNMYFYNDYFIILAYNLETIMAEKIETIFSRGELNTRLKDYYDVYILFKQNNFNIDLFIMAFKATTTKRGTTRIINQLSNILDVIKESNDIKNRWLIYSRDYNYANDIEFDELMFVLTKIVELIK